MDLFTVTSLLTKYPLNETAKILMVQSRDITDFLESNGLSYHNGTVVPTIDVIEEVAATKKIELNPPRVKKVKRRTLGMDITTMENWDEFTEARKEYNIYELVTLALNEFMDKYK